MFDASGNLTNAVNPSLGSSALAQTWTVGTGGVTANTFVKVDATGTAVVAVGTSDTTWHGVALSTVAQGGTVEVAVVGRVPVKIDGTTTIGNAAIISTTTGGYAHDSGTTRETIASSASIGTIRGSCLAACPGTTVTIELLSGARGALAGVTTFNGRSGAVTPQSGDYTAAQVTNAVDQTGSYANPSWITSLAYSKLTGAPSSTVTSFNSRTGAVTPQSGDYTAAQVTNAVSTLGSYANPSWITSLDYAKLTGTPTSVVTSFNTRTGAVTPQSGDYTAAQVTNAVSTTGSYADPSWLTSLAYSKLTGVPGALTYAQFLTGTTDPGVPAVPSVVHTAQQRTLGTGTVSTVLTFPTTGSLTAGNVLVVWSECSNSPGYPTISDSQGNTWSTAVQNPSFLHKAFVAVIGTSAAETITATCSSVTSGGFTNIIAYEIAGSNGVVDANTLGESITTSVGEDLIFMSADQQFAFRNACTATSPSVADFAQDDLCVGRLPTTSPGAYVGSLTYNSTATSDSFALEATPVASPGNNGDVYLNTTTGILWLKTAGTWATTGRVIPFLVSGTTSLSFGAIPDGNCAVQTMTVNGVAAGDLVQPQWPSTLESGLFGTAVATATNTVQLRLCNLSGASVTPATQTFGARVLR
jgi:hypothetical protein